VALAPERNSYWPRTWQCVCLSELLTGVRQLVQIVIGAASAF
jgi:hypothetical protein